MQAQLKTYWKTPVTIGMAMLAVVLVTLSVLPGGSVLAQPGDAKTLFQSPLPTPAPGILGYHVVRYRETLSCIGRAYAVSPWAIASQNRIYYPYTLYIGQRLAIPNVPWRSSYGPVCVRQFGPTPPGPIPPGPIPPGCRANYVVRQGDTLYAIALRYGTTLWALVNANHIANPNLIFVGQVLCIP